MSGRQTALTHCSLGRINTAFQKAQILTSHSSAQKTEQGFFAQIFNIKVKFMVRSFIHLWQGGERWHIKKMHGCDAYKADVSETVEKNIFCACYGNGKYKPTNHHSWKIKI